ncbi:MAG: hypothetical protein OXE99_14680 [Cellvibrionales bacterium]|nr:hypothetical protein [Cellvibrionales bacterium]
MKKIIVSLFAILYLSTAAFADSPVKPNNKMLKNVAIGGAVVTILSLAGATGYLAYSKKKTNDDLEQKSKELDKVKASKSNLEAGVFQKTKQLESTLTELQKSENFNNKLIEKLEKKHPNNTQMFREQVLKELEASKELKEESGK